MRTRNRKCCSLPSGVSLGLKRYEPIRMSLGCTPYKVPGFILGVKT